MDNEEMSRIEPSIGALDIGALSRAEPGQVVAMTTNPRRAVICLQPAGQGLETTVVVIDSTRSCSGPFWAGSKSVGELDGIQWIRPTKFIGREGWEAILRHLQNLALYGRAEFVKPLNRSTSRKTSHGESHAE